MFKCLYWMHENNVFMDAFFNVNALTFIYSNTDTCHHLVSWMVLNNECLILSEGMCNYNFQAIQTMTYSVFYKMRFIWVNYILEERVLLSVVHWLFPVLNNSMWLKISVSNGVSIQLPNGCICLLRINDYLNIFLSLVLYRFKW